MPQIIIDIPVNQIVRVRNAFRNAVGNPTFDLPELKVYLHNEIKRIVKLDEGSKAADEARRTAEAQDVTLG